jgi:flagellar protein FliO/FliZ
MFETLFGTEMPLALRFFVAFVIVLGLIGGAAYLVRRFGATALNAAASARGRQPRLAVIDAAAIDGRRRLVLIRRDNVEHLIMIGGPTDVVVEPNIVRAIPAAPARETPPPRVTGNLTDTLPRAVPLAESGWPLQPEPAPRPQRERERAPPVDEAANWTAQPEPPPRAAPERPDRPERESVRESARESVRESAPRVQNTDRLAGLAADLSRNFMEPEPAPPPRRSAEPRRAAPPPAPPISEDEEQNLAEMAHRLESALQRPRQSGEPPAEPAVPAPRGGGEPATAPVEPKPVRAEPKPAPKTAPKPAFDSLEQEMASLLGRPAGKT